MMVLMKITRCYDTIGNVQCPQAFNNLWVVSFQALTVKGKYSQGSCHLA